MVLYREATMLFAALVATTATAADWSGLPWDDLSLSSNATLVHSDGSAQAAAYVNECVPEFKNLTFMERTHHNLVDQKSGLCMNQMACAFEQCNPLNPTTHADITVEERIALGKGNMNDNDQPKNQTEVDGWLATDNPAWNLPTTVLFPVTAGDVVGAINFAKDHGLEVSVKNSGHSYTGASSKKDTLHLNMNRFTPYAPTGVMDCDSTADADSAFQSDLSDQPCRLAKARGKPGVLRVGGGENFSESYLAVKAFNEANGSYKYNLLGGGAGTVSPMGWTFQGGLGSTTGGRIFGFGVDQVIRVDMVLPSGQHVRFGPTKWEDSEDFIVPKTTSVSGVCHQNPDEEDESKWTWSNCDEDINFDDLWFAVRGGGGGTWGVITSMILQLHEYHQLESVNPVLLWDCIPFETLLKFLPIFNKFVELYLLNPSAVNVTEEDSRRCGAFASQAFCYGKDSSKPYLAAFSYFISDKNQTLIDMGLNVSLINDAASACSNAAPIFDDYASAILIAEGPHQGKALDGPPPTYMSTTEEDVNLIVPAKYYLENDVTDKFPPFYSAFGGNAQYSSDQADSLSAAHRSGGNMVITSLTILDENFYTDVFPKMYDTSDPTNFPGFVGSNHGGPNMRGPLKDDWTKPCPLNWTTKERDEKCISLQEAIWGTKLLKRLEKIKEDIDPNYMFDCYGCIGNDRPKSKEDESSDAEGEDETPSDASTTEEDESSDAEGEVETTSDASTTMSWKASLLSLVALVVTLFVY